MLEQPAAKYYLTQNLYNKMNAPAARFKQNYREAKYVCMQTVVSEGRLVSRITAVFRCPPGMLDTGMAPGALHASHQPSAVAERETIFNSC